VLHLLKLSSDPVKKIPRINHMFQNIAHNDAIKFPI